MFEQIFKHTFIRILVYFYSNGHFMHVILQLGTYELVKYKFCSVLHAFYANNIINYNARAIENWKNIKENSFCC